ncbi:maleylpyruvate isomerase family mycothiol-dependent enzyme [Arthrobacter sp. ZGTC212]|uniref:maleylpyruvate isomerase family mycothiol-dependent enzyme n=1 Tax=Arthrobacter sp. ZGTC212 TaxID=2058899 RepID=UPI000CE41CA1|nr:maleylpyruvate isomerase family mycothiol-dependent enzyme [Arthrobacter sp. ZGTC212]
MTGFSNAPGSSVPKSPERPPSSQLLSNVGTAAADFRSRVASLTDADVRAPSRLPGWSRGHVLAHVAGVADAMARQLDYAARGETIELYNGGSDGRNRAIEEGSVRSADRLRAELDAALDRALSAFRDLSDEDWHAPISYRDGVVRDGGLALWRELVIHATDLGTGSEADSWSPLFCEHLFDFLSARVPAGVRVRLQPFGMAPRVLTGNTGTQTFATTGSTVSVNGMATDIAAWLAGRTPNLGSLRAEAAADGIDLPKLLPWPSGIPAK